MLNTELLPVAVAVALSLLSGTGVFLMEVRAGRLNATLSNFLAEALTAVTAGLMALFLAKYKGFDAYATYFAVLLTSNNGKEILLKAKSINMDAITKALINILSKGNK